MKYFDHSKLPKIGEECYIILQSKYTPRYNNTKWILGKYHKWITGRKLSIYDIYERPSEKTVSDYKNHIFDAEKNYKATDIKIVTWNTFTYTIAYVGYFNGTKTFFFQTPKHLYYCSLATMHSMYLSRKTTEIQQSQATYIVSKNQTTNLKELLKKEREKTKIKYTRKKDKK